MSANSHTDVAPSPRCAVVLAVYNGMEWLAGLMDSVLQQRGVAVTLFVSVDPSTDGSGAYVARCAADDERIVLLPPRPVADGAAGNFYRLLTEVDLDGFDYLAMADQDDIWLRGKLLRAITMMKKNRARAYSSNVIALWQNGRKRPIDKAQPQRRWDFLFEAAGPGCTYVFDVALARQIQAFVAAGGAQVRAVDQHDWLLYAYVRSRGLRWYIDSRPSLYYRQHDSNYLGANIGWSMARRRLEMIGNGWYRCQAQLIARLCVSGYQPFVTAVFGDNWWGGCYLLCHIGVTRRRLRDRVILACACILNKF